MGLPLLKKSARSESRFQVQGHGLVTGSNSSRRIEVQMCDVSSNGISFLAKKSDFQKDEPVQIEIEIDDPPRKLRLKGFILSNVVTAETIPLARFSVKFEKKFSPTEFKQIMQFFIFK